MGERLDHSGLCVIGLVGDDRLGRRVLEQDICTVQIMGLPRREVKARRIAQRIDNDM